MPGPTLTVPELAAELGRRESWLYDNWRKLCGRHRMPPPLHQGDPPLVWDRAQIMAWKDRQLSRPEQVAAAAFRAAAAAAEGARLTAGADAAIVEARRKLDEEWHAS
jgi:predicted DNA-binding transcriptional regulator AlpA